MNPDRSAILNRLLRSISLSAGEFALLLARCNSSVVRDQVVDELRLRLGMGLYLWQATPEVGAINLVEILESAPEGTQVACVTGLETSPHLNDILTIANNAREEFRSRFRFPLVLWVTDEVEAQLRRRSPDLASWAAPPFGFALDQTELQAILEQATADIVEQAFSQASYQSVEPDLAGVWQEWQRSGASLSLEVEARVALLLGLDAGSDAAALTHLERCLALVNSGALAAAAQYRLGCWWQQHGKQQRAEFLADCDRAREHLEQAWQNPAGKQANVMLALGAVLVELALPEAQDSARWQAVAEFAEQVAMYPALSSGLRAEVALARQDYSTAQREAEQAIQFGDRPREGWYRLSLGRSLLGMQQAEAAIASLEQAKAVTPPEVDPDLHIRILRSLHQAYTAAGQYRQAFAVKCDRQGVEAQYGFRAFIGAGRLRPQRQIGDVGAGATEEIAASGRQGDIDALVERVKRSDCRLTVIHGPSGVGKSSLLQAGLVPALRKLIHQSRSVVPVVVEQYEDWQRELRIQLGWARGVFPNLSRESEISTDLLIAQLRENNRHHQITVLIFDQFEEFFFKHPDVPGRRQWYDFLRACLEVPFVWVVLSLREDYVHYLLECDRLANLTLINNDILNKNVRYYLGNFDPERARAVIWQLTERSPYRLEAALCDRLVADLTAELGEVRPIELQVVGAQMVQSESPITTLGAYTDLGEQPKQALVERWLNQVVQDCGQGNGELAQRVLVALTEEPEKRPVRTRTELQRELRQGESPDPRLLRETGDLGMPGDLEFVLTVLVGSGLAFELPATPEAGYQLIHDYLVPPIRRQFGVKWAQQLALERQQRQIAEANLRKRNRWLLQGSLVAAGIFAVLGLTAIGFGLQANQEREQANWERVKAQKQ
jgi:tetratricopeptide (TPR) repeat protein